MLSPSNKMVDTDDLATLRQSFDLRDLSAQGNSGGDLSVEHRLGDLLLLLPELVAGLRDGVLDILLEHLRHDVPEEVQAKGALAEAAQLLLDCDRRSLWRREHSSDIHCAEDLCNRSHA